MRGGDVTSPAHPLVHGEKLIPFIAVFGAKKGEFGKNPKDLLRVRLINPRITAMVFGVNPLGNGCGATAANSPGKRQFFGGANQTIFCTQNESRPRSQRESQKMRGRHNLCGEG